MSPLIEWSNQLAINHEIIDEQHKEMIAMINRLHDCITEPAQRVQFSAQLEQLCNYTMGHFATEERLMRQLEYPHLARHQAQHALLSQQAYELNQRFRGGSYRSIPQSLRHCGNGCSTIFRGRIGIWGCSCCSG